MEEKLAAKYIDDQKGDFLVVQVADAEHFKRSLKLTNSLLSRGLPVVLVLTMCKKFRARGGKLDCGRLSEAFGIRCIETDALRRKSVKALAEALKEVFLSLSQYREKSAFPVEGQKIFLGSVIECSFDGGLLWQVFFDGLFSRARRCR